MQTEFATISPASVALRIGGVMGAVAAVLLAAAAIVRPDMVMAALHAMAQIMH